MRAPFPLVVAHRGASLTHPENTLPAIAAARDMGVDLIELDVRTSRDGVAVLMHDRELRRTTGQTGTVDGAYHAALRLLDAGLWRGERFRGTPVPSLVEAATSVSGTAIGLCLEFKDAEHLTVEAATASICSSLRQLDSAGRAVVNIARAELARSLKNQEPGLRIALDSKERDWLGGSPEAIAAEIARSGSDIVEYEHRFLTPAIVRACRRLGIGVWAWTANDAVDWQRLVAMGADAILTDDPAGLIAFLDGS
jgi:glycerophosphoryl diester phosphodiesterase